MADQCYDLLCADHIQLSIFPLGSFNKKDKLFPSSTATMRSWLRHVSPDPALEKAAGEHEQAGHLGGLLWIKSYFQRVPTCATRPGKRPWNYGRTHYSEPLSTRPHTAGTTAQCKRSSTNVSQNERRLHVGRGPEGRRRTGLWSRLCLSCDHGIHV